MGNFFNGSILDLNFTCMIKCGFCRDQNWKTPMSIQENWCLTSGKLENELMFDRLDYNLLIMLNFKKMAAKIMNSSTNVFGDWNFQ